MGAEVLINRKISYEEYLQLEAQGDVRYEFYDGEVVAMAGVSLNHSRITNNISRLLSNVLEDGSCEVFQEGVQLSYSKENHYVYPDIMVTCHPDDIESGYSIKHPNLIVEVLSPTTAAKDKGEKLAIYCTISSLRYYLIVHQSKPYIEVYSRKSALSVFQYEVFKEVDDVIKITEPDLTFTFENVYRNVRFNSNI